MWFVLAFLFILGMAYAGREGKSFRANLLFIFTMTVIAAEITNIIDFGVVVPVLISGIWLGYSIGRADKN